MQMVNISRMIQVIYLYLMEIIVVTTFIRNKVTVNSFLVAFFELLDLLDFQNSFRVSN